MMIMAVALIALPTMAQQQEWRSTSPMQGAGSTYTPQVNAVGAAAVEEMATTTASYSPAKAPGGPRRVETPGGGSSGEGGTGHNNPGTGGYDSPIGDAVLPLMLFAGAFLCMRVFLIRRKRALSR
jgi:hypothetical protein